MHLIPQWVASKANAAADLLSRVNMTDNCRIRPVVMQAFVQHFGPIAVDRFATAANAVCPTFNSYFWEPGCAAVDAFAQSDWLQGLNFVNPPFSQVGRAV